MAAGKNVDVGDFDGYRMTPEMNAAQAASCWAGNCPASATLSEEAHFSTNWRNWSLPAPTHSSTLMPLDMTAKVGIAVTAHSAAMVCITTHSSFQQHPGCMNLPDMTSGTSHLQATHTYSMRMFSRELQMDHSAVDMGKKIRIACINYKQTGSPDHGQHRRLKRVYLGRLH